MEWHQINTRRISLQMCLFWNNGLGEKERKAYGIGARNFLNYFDGHKTEYYIGRHDWQKYKAGLERMVGERKWVRTLPWEAQEFLEKQLARFQKEFPKNLQKLSTPELLSLQKKVAQEVAWTNSRTWIIYLSSDVIAERVKKELEKVVRNTKKVDEYILSFSTPLEINEALKEHMELLKLAILLKKTSPALFQKKLALHARRFNHIPMFGFDHKPYTLEHFKKELAAIENPEKELQKLGKTMAGRKEKFERELRQLNLKKTDFLFELIQMLKHTVFVRDYRDTLRQKMYLLDSGMYDEIGKRLWGLSAQETTNLTNEEIEEGLKGKNLQEIRKTVGKRMESFLVIQKGEKVEVLEGKEAAIRFGRELKKTGLAEVDFIQGVSASPGTARGPAKIVETNEDLYKIKKGDVMVAHVTRQDFVPAMRRCAAIITDEGGITNHAAIVAREFGIPCVVGAKVAVKWLKDGDLVEVDAKRSVIRKV